MERDYSTGSTDITFLLLSLLKWSICFHRYNQVFYKAEVNIFIVLILFWLILWYFFSSFPCNALGHGYNLDNEQNRLRVAVIISGSKGVLSSKLLCQLCFFLFRKVCVWNKGKDTTVIDTSTLAYLLKVLCIIPRILSLGKSIKILFMITYTTISPTYFDVQNFFLWNYKKKGYRIFFYSFYSSSICISLWLYQVQKLLWCGCWSLIQNAH